MQLTDYHAKYFAYELTKRCSSDSVEKLASVLADAQVDLNPHQVEAAHLAPLVFRHKAQRFQVARLSLRTGANNSEGARKSRASESSSGMACSS